MRVIASTCDWRFSKLHIEPFVLFLYFTKWLHFRIRRNAKCDHHHQHHCHCRRRRCCRRRISIQRNFIAWHRMWCTHKLCCHRMRNLDKIELATRIEVAAISGAWFGRLSRTAFFLLSTFIAFILICLIWKRCYAFSSVNVRSANRTTCILAMGVPVRCVCARDVFVSFFFVFFFYLFHSHSLQ